MKFTHVILIFSLVCFYKTIFSVELTELVNAILNTYESKAFYGIRTVVEYGVRWRYRDEEIYRYKGEKLVRVNLPENIVWFRNSNGYFLVDSKGNVASSFIRIVDLEDILLGVLKSGEFKIVSFEKIENNGLMNIELIHKNQIFKFLVSGDDYKIIRIERKIPNLKTVMMYNRLVEITPQHFKKVMEKYTGKLKESKNVVTVNSSKVELYIKNAMKLFKFYIVNRINVKDTSAIIIAGETRSGNRLSVIIAQGKDVKISVSNLLNLPKGFRIDSFYENGIKIFVISDCDENEMKKIKDEIKGVKSSD